MNFTQNSSTDTLNNTLPEETPALLNSDDATWILTSAFIIFTMQSGFGLVESGMFSFCFQSEYLERLASLLKVNC